MRADLPAFPPFYLFAVFAFRSANRAAKNAVVKSMAGEELLFVPYTKRKATYAIAKGQRTIRKYMALAYLSALQHSTVLSVP